MLQSGKACHNENATLGKDQMNSNGNHQTLLSTRGLAMLLLLGSLALTTGVERVFAKSTENTPHFAALKADEVHVRKGPGRNYDIVWTYRSLGLPVEVTAKHEHWRRVRDSTGAEGWVYFRLLTALRMALISPWQKKKITIPLHKDASTGSSSIAKLEPGVKVLVKSCTGNWCLVSVEGFKGWIEQKKLWGIYPGEIIE
jgi:SH3-like domain-containing protein